MESLERHPEHKAELYLCRYKPQCLKTPPWKDALFDCFVLVPSEKLTDEECRKLAFEIADTNTDWVHTLGESSEKLHDAIDLMAIEIGRQVMVGEGIPMTSWHEELTSLPDMATFVSEGGLGHNCDYQLVILVGTEQEYLKFKELLLQSLDKRNRMNLGAFSVSLAVQDLATSKAFYEKLGFQEFAGDATQNWLIMKNGDHAIGLFQGMFEQNILTFNPGWNQDATPLESFTDVRKLQAEIKAQGVPIVNEADESTTGPASFVVVDPDGNSILIDQHV